MERITKEILATTQQGGTRAGNQKEEQEFLLGTIEGKGRSA